MMKKEEKRKTHPKEELGITLVALVITVIVLLILAGAAINMAINSEGLFGKANEAVEEWNSAVGEEESQLENLIEKANSIGGTGITYVGEVPIPSGYVASKISTEDEKTEGLVIYEIPEGATVNWQEDEADGTNESTITIGGSTTNLQESRNQYVWIPVEDINSMVMCESNNKLADGEGNKICNLVYDAAKNELKCTNSAHSATATNLVGRLYTSSLTGSNPSSYIMDFTKRDQKYNTNGNREPDDVPDTSNGDASSEGIAGIKEILGNDTASSYEAIEEKWNNLLKSEFTVMAKSVARYGGFYISRYEIGRETVEGVEVATSKKGQPVLTADDTGGGSGATAYLGADMWYGLYKTIKNSGTKKQMIWGCQYDQVIKFLKEKGEEPETGHNYISRTRALSGQNEQDCMRNIYDLEGN